ncbi:MAG: carbon starvation CstA family protein, partial [Elusimicrobiota bacterium]|nr:carbon starvation CstA family protein [Elusimicrobiota bacterium]
SVFLWLSLVFVVAVFAAIGAATMVSKPEIVLPALGIIPVAVIVGLLIYKARVSQAAATIVGLLLLAGLLIAGNYYPVELTAWTNDPQRTWMIILLLYAFIASILPVNILLQPRDYISAFLLFFGLFFGYLGIAFTNPVLSAPAFTGSIHPAGGPLWPMLFVTIACGAISGFHSVVASGTTSKQLSSEKDAKAVGAGAMVAEAALAVLALITVAAGLKSGVYRELMAGGASIGAFAAGYGNLTRPFFGGYGSLIAVTILNAFIITTLDSATRISRYLTEELFRVKNKYISTSIVIIFAFYLALGSWQRIWPVFGASNQLVATLTLLVLSAYLFSKNKKTIYTAVPAVMMFFTSGGALVWQLSSFIKSGNYLLSLIAGLLLALALYMALLTVNYFRRHRKREITDAG